MSTPSGELYLLHSKHQSSKPKRDGIATRPIDDLRTKAPGGNATFVLVPDNDLNAKDYVTDNHNFMLIETQNIRALDDKFLMIHSAGAYFNNTQKTGIAYSDTFLLTQHPSPQCRRRIVEGSPYQNQAGQRYECDQVVAPGISTVARIGTDNDSVLTISTFDSDDAPRRLSTAKEVGSLRQLRFINMDVNGL
ncbi:hypothetical protein F4777DRAFT_581452 [Nemania sp. FL0916]|nr:hypothetical protein F4777DRAFT_581452 [Nemania sp. FL0916]